MVDSTDRARLDQCRAELQALLGQEKLAGASLLILCNKQDLSGALSLEEIRDALQLQGIGPQRHFNAVTCSAVTKQGLEQGVSWLVQDIASRIFFLS